MDERSGRVALAAQCRAKREAAGVSLREMGKRTFRDPSVISRFERGMQTPHDLDGLLRAYDTLTPVDGTTQRPFATVRKPRALSLEREPSWFRPALWLIVALRWVLVLGVVLDALPAGGTIATVVVLLSTVPLFVHDCWRLLDGLGKAPTVELAVVAGDAAIIAGVSLFAMSGHLLQQDLLFTVAELVTLAGLDTRLVAHLYRQDSAPTA